MNQAQANVSAEEAEAKALARCYRLLLQKAAERRRRLAQAGVGPEATERGAEAVEEDAAVEQ